MVFKEIFKDFYCKLEDITGFGLEYDGYYVHLNGTKVKVPTVEEGAKVTELLIKRPVIKLDANTECLSCAVRKRCGNTDYGSEECNALRTVALAKVNMEAECIRCANWSDCNLADKAITHCMNFKPIKTHTHT